MYVCAFVYVYVCMYVCVWGVPSCKLFTTDLGSSLPVVNPLSCIFSLTDTVQSQCGGKTFAQGHGGGGGGGRGGGMRDQGKSQHCLPGGGWKGSRNGLNLDQMPLAAPGNFSGPCPVRSDKSPS